MTSTDTRPIDSRLNLARRAALQNVFRQSQKQESQFVDDESLSFLPSTIPETITIEDSRNIERSEFRTAMSQQSQNGTQVLSQSVIDSIITKNKSRRYEETQNTLEEGDTGHVDILSSFADRSDDEDQFMPTQSLFVMTQFPDSQRFKTPATVGKKRRYNGKLVETPELPRNPLARNDHSKSLGLSQAFAATQAASSPFVPRAINPTSDLPSPDLAIQVRPITADNSSPLRPISEFKRAATEPASRYVSSKESQAGKFRRKTPVPESDDDFDDEPSLVQQRKIAREREERASRQLKLASSPIRASDHFQISSDRSRRSLPSSPSRLNLQNESEEETEEEVDVERSSQEPIQTEEDKENMRHEYMIPETVARLHGVVTIAEVQASPLQAQSRLNLDVQSSEPFAIADSQSSQSRLQKSGMIKSELSKSVAMEDESTHLPGKRQLSDDTRERFAQTISSLLKTTSWDKHTESNIECNIFATAHSHRNGELSSTPGELSSQPIVVTPPGARRRRMAQIAEEPSPFKPQTSFDAGAALHIEAEFQETPVLPTAATSSSERPQIFKITLPDVRENSVATPSQVQQSSPLQPRAVSRPSKQNTMTPKVSRGRKSVWDMEISPRKLPKPKAQFNRHTKRLAGNATPEESPDPLATSAEIPQIVHDAIVMPNMVFACFSGKTRAYYPARCLGSVAGDNNRYQVQWEGYAPDEVDIQGIRSLDLRIGDLVKIDHDGIPKITHIVRGFKDSVTDGETITDIRGHKTVLVVPKHRKSFPGTIIPEKPRPVPVSAVYLDSNMWKQMKERTYDVRDTMPSTPAERPSTPVTPSSRSRRTQVVGIFSGMAFAVSYDDVERRDNLTKMISANGGEILQSFEDLFDDFQMKSQYYGLGFTALVADRHSRKPKFMQALALGLPCVNGRWIDGCISHDEYIDWTAYLLPAGESLELEGATRSRVLPGFEPTLKSMLDSRPILFADRKILLVIGRGKAEAKRKHFLFLLAALGAKNVETTPDLRSAKDKKDFHWLFVEDKDVEVARGILKDQNCRVAGNEMIVQTLILSRLYES